jgi:nucleoside-diphosphate-sugar epimerase
MNLKPRAPFWSGRRVAVTGATGFLGLHVACRLATLGARVLALVRSPAKCGHLAAAGIGWAEAPLEDPAALARGCRGCEFVFHLAGAVDFEGDWDRFWRVNVDGSRRVAEAARAGGVRRLIHTSSIVAIGASSEPRVLDESERWNLASLRIPYISTKRAAEEAVLALRSLTFDVVVVNPASVVGPGDYAQSEFGTLCHRFWRGHLPFHFGGGSNFVDVRDVATGHLLAAEHGRSGERYLLSGHNRSYNAFFAGLARAARRSIFRLCLPRALGTLAAALNERWQRRRPGRSYLTPAQARLLGWFFYFNCDKARRELGYHPRPLHATLADAHAFWMGRQSA